MSAIYPTGRSGSGDAAAPGTSGWLGLAAAPTFAAMGLYSALAEAPAGILCMSSGPPALGGMSLMYALMALFHLAPWGRLLTWYLRPPEAGLHGRGP